MIIPKFEPFQPSPPWRDLRGTRGPNAWRVSHEVRSAFASPSAAHRNLPSYDAKMTTRGLFLMTPHAFRFSSTRACATPSAHLPANPNRSYRSRSAGLRFRSDPFVRADALRTQRRRAHCAVRSLLFHLRVVFAYASHVAHFSSHSEHRCWKAIRRWWGRGGLSPTALPRRAFSSFGTVQLRVSRLCSPRFQAQVKQRQN